MANGNPRYTAYIALLVSTFTLWMLVNPTYSGSNAGMIYTAFAVVVIVAFLESNKLKIASKIYGIQPGAWNKLVKGFFYGGIIVLGSKLTNLSIGLPPVPASMEDNISFLVICIVAPVIEELFFRALLLGAINSRVPFGTAALITALAFSVFHLTAYGVGMSSAFLAAFIFGIIAAYITRKEKDALPAIGAHSVYNFAVWAGLVVSGFSKFVGG